MAALMLWQPLINNLNDCGLLNLTATNDSATFTQPGKIGGNANTGQYTISSPDLVNIFNGDEFSLVFWINLFETPTETTTQDTYVFKCGTTSTRKCLHIATNVNNGRFAFGFYGDDCTILSSTSSIIGSWIHVVCTYKNNIQTTYVNGIQQNQHTTSANLSIGSTHNLVVYSKHSLLQDLRVYDYCLSPKEIQLLSRGLVTHYPMCHDGIPLDDVVSSTSIVHDCSGYCRNATIVGTPTYVGESARYTVGTKFPNSSATYVYASGLKQQIMTWSCWFKCVGTGAETNQIILSEGHQTGSRGCEIWLDKAGTMLYGYCHNTNLSKAVTLNTWHHVAITANGSLLRFYVDGTMIYSTSYLNDTDYSQSYNTFVIGKTAYNYYNATSSQYPFNGVISDVRIYATALDDDAIAELYHTPISVGSNGTIFVSGEYIEDTTSNAIGMYRCGDIVAPTTEFNSNDLPSTVTQPSYAAALSPHGFVESGSLAKIYDGHVMTNEFIEA